MTAQLTTINRQALVRRHNPTIREVDWNSPLSLGNGEFAMTMDITGLQTFDEFYDEYGIPLGTMSTWGWHSKPNPQGYRTENYPMTEFAGLNRSVPYRYIPAFWMVGEPGWPDEVNWLKENPHRLHLGTLGFRLFKASGNRAFPSDLTDIEQTLDLWTGILTSHFRLEGQLVLVTTCCHPTRDIIAVHVTSSLLRTGQIQLEWRFPYGTDGVNADWSHPKAHTTEAESSENGVVFSRCLDNDSYTVQAEWSSHAEFVRERQHSFVVKPAATDTFSLCSAFSPTATPEPLPSFDKVHDASTASWVHYWSEGGMVELAESADPRALELERRIILSQYQIAVHCAGSVPPQESGLVHNSWAGKFHLEMHWWHAAHFITWGREHLFERSMRWYEEILPRARELAQSQGFPGVRWPKCADPSGVNAPCFYDQFIIWQQPHPIHFAELLYRGKPGRETLEHYQEIVEQTAEFMAAFVQWDEQGQRYVLGPPIGVAQEIYDISKVINPTYELSYWAWGLQAAQRWRERLGLPRHAQWDTVLDKLSPLPMVDGLYVAVENMPETWTKYRNDHPTLLASYGILPGEGVDAAAMERTLDMVLKEWCWENTWGWDPPMVAMTAARLGKPEQAIDALFIDTPLHRNKYLPNGLVRQSRQLVYLPSNGALLIAIGMMAGGWDGAPDIVAPGFPQDGSWTVHVEGLRPLP